MKQNNKGWVVFIIDGIQMAISKENIKQIAARTSLTKINDETYTSKEGWSILRVNHQFLLGSKNQRRFALIIEALKAPIGLMCDDIQIMGAEENPTFIALPAIFTGFEGVATGFLQFGENKLATIMDVTSLGILLENLEAKNG